MANSFYSATCGSAIVTAVCMISGIDAKGSAAVTLVFAVAAIGLTIWERFRA